MHEASEHTQSLAAFFAKLINTFHMEGMYTLYIFIFNGYSSFLCIYGVYADYATIALKVQLPYSIELSYTRTYNCK